MGCGKDSNVNTHIEEGKSAGSIIVHVSDGDPISRPIYTWSEGTDNTVTRVKVARTTNTNISVWEVRSTDPSQDSIQSPWQHATATSFAFQTAGTEIDLDTDIWYRVTVTKADLHTGYREFRIKP